MRLLIAILFLSVSGYGQTSYCPINIGAKSSATTYMTFDPINYGSHTTISGSNLTATITSSASGSEAIGNIFHATGVGKYYGEVTSTFASGPTTIGFIGSSYVTADLSNYVGHGATQWGEYLYSTGYTYHNATAINTGYTGSVQASGSVFCYAFDAIAGNFYLGVVAGGNTFWYSSSGGSYSFASATPLNTSPVSGSYTICVGYANSGTETHTLNSGQSAYSGTKPSGYVNW